MTLNVNEIFGPTIQGEGASTGKHALFVRLANCNLQCSWCDTPHTWVFTEAKAARHLDRYVYDKASQVKEMSNTEILEQLSILWPPTNNPTTIVITGGEPLLQRKQLVSLVQLLTEYGHRIEVETAGTLEPSELQDYVAQWNVSPKLEHSGNPLNIRYRPEVLRKFANDVRSVTFKFVLRSIDDFVEVDKIVNECEIDPKAVWVMPEGIKTSELVSTGKAIIPHALERGWNFTYRLHNLIWGNERGR